MGATQWQAQALPQLPPAALVVVLAVLSLLLEALLRARETDPALLRSAPDLALEALLLRLIEATDSASLANDPPSGD